MALRWFLALACGLVFYGAAQAQTPACSTARPKIVGGTTAKLNDWPGLAAIRLHAESGKVSEFFCGGSVIADRWVVTAAHCLPEFVKTTTGILRDSQAKEHEGRLEVVVGITDVTKVSPDNVFMVVEVVVHDDYRAAIDAALKLPAHEAEKAIENIAQRVGNDVALLKLDRPWRGPKARHRSRAPASGWRCAPERQRRTSARRMRCAPPCCAPRRSATRPASAVAT